MPRLLHNHNRLLARPNCRHLRRLLDRPLPAHRWQGQTHRGLLVPEEIDNSLVIACDCSLSFAQIKDGKIQDEMEFRISGNALNFAAHTAWRVDLRYDDEYDAS